MTIKPCERCERESLIYGLGLCHSCWVIKKSKNNPKVKKSKRLWREKNKKKLQKYYKNYYKENEEHLKEYGKEYYHKKNTL